MTAPNPTPRSFNEADAILKGRASRKIANNTYLERRDGHGVAVIAVRLHDTDVITWSETGDVVFNTGGYNTVTTRDRLNQYAPVGIRFASRKGQLHVLGIGESETPIDDMLTLGLAPV